LLGVIGGGALLVFALFPDTIISILMGHKYLMFAHLLPKLSLAMFLFSILNMLLVYCIAMREYQVTWIVAAGMGLTALLMVLRHGTVAAVVTNLIYCGFTTLALFGGWIVIRKLQKRRAIATVTTL
jgi:O-antigen/teichoic acid export membrane protein